LVKRKVQSEVDSFFGSHIRISARALQALAAARDIEFGGLPEGEWGATTAHLLYGVLRAYPTIPGLLENCGLNLKRIENTTVVNNGALPLGPAFEVAFRNDADDFTTLNDVGKGVAKRSLLEVEDLLIAPLTSPYILNPAEDKSFNDVVSVLAPGLGIDGNPEDHDEQTVQAVGQYANALRNVDLLDSSHSHQQWLLEHDGQRYRIRPFAPWGVYQFNEAPLKDGSLWVARGNLVQPVTTFSGEAISELEHLINASASERSFQEFFERNPEFLTMLGNYQGIHPQLVLPEDDGGRLVPDFFLEKINSTFCDICDLKLPTKDLKRFQRHRMRFRDAVIEAVAQLEHYRRWFENPKHVETFHKSYGLSAYRPKVVVIIGRRSSYYDEVERIQMEALLPSHFTLRTYDDVIDQARTFRARFLR
jgi:hypothetical protein